MAHQAELKVRFYELDPYGHLNHSAFIQYFETGRVELLEQVGHGLHQLAARGYQIVIDRMEVRFVKPVHAGEVITVETEVLSMRRTLSVWEQRLVRDGQLVARAQLRAAITNRQGKPVRAPDDLVQALRPYLAAAS